MLCLNTNTIIYPIPDDCKLKNTDDGVTDREESSAATQRASNTDRLDRVTHSRTTTTTTVSLPGGAPDSSPRTNAPIIVLQEPVIVQPQVSQPADEQTGSTTGNGQRPSRTLNPYNPRHQRILRRQNTDDEIFLTPDALEQIVFHNAPVPDGMQGPDASAMPPSKP